MLRQLVWVDFTAGCRLDLVGGYRFLRYQDGVQISDSSTTSGGVLPVTTFTSIDTFNADNQFHAGEIGLNAAYYRNRWSLDVLGKIALGNNHQVVNINGTNSVTALGTTITSVGGLLAQPTNIGGYQRNEFAVLPELNVNIRYDLTQRMRLMAGYTLFYLNNMVTSGGRSIRRSTRRRSAACWWALPARPLPSRIRACSSTASPRGLNTAGDLAAADMVRRDQNENGRAEQAAPTRPLFVMRSGLCDIVEQPVLILGEERVGRQGRSHGRGEASHLVHDRADCLRAGEDRPLRIAEQDLEGLVPFDARIAADLHGDVLRSRAGQERERAARGDVVGRRGGVAVGRGVNHGHGTSAGGRQVDREHGVGRAGVPFRNDQVGDRQDRGGVVIDDRGVPLRAPA